VSEGVKGRNGKDMKRVKKREDNEMILSKMKYYTWRQTKGKKERCE
jgi:hypothetical protein